MEEQLISFDTAKLAKENGFTGYKSHVFYYKTGELYIKGSMSFCEDWNTWEYTDGIRWAAPSQAILQRWLREKHSIDLMIGTGAYPRGSNKWLTVILSPSDELPIQLKGYRESYEQALEYGLIEALKLIK